MPERRVKAICPHCSRPIELILEEGGENQWMVCTPLPIEEKDLSGKEGKAGGGAGGSRS